MLVGNDDNKLWLGLDDAGAWLEDLLADKTRIGHGIDSPREVFLSAVIKALVNALEARDRYIYRHSAGVAVLAGKIASKLVWSEKEAYYIELASLLHDIGKIGMPDAVLGKPGSLTPEEWELMRRHPDIGADIIADIPGMVSVADIVRHHHERWDGRGYPAGLAGAAIPLGARIVAVADSFQAMVSDRPYRARRSAIQAMQEIKAAAGSQFDPAVVEAFIDVFNEYCDHKKQATGG
ncbi:HD-GYP domain-containing protein [Sporolituus thermophilus]|uniref:HDIG domain-containing protein n=1 Tax=Sporolituus thermophilus DSM 23256 TaxID=1123285 RepID=A0A1G7JSY3_9FIRM|nr:HD-GYP domain-containing protein [Sporolituus thermophilus]SDF28043.1 HDIG domain-containing protein [Sporolituus thermophilus DSM 23256]